jgi:hypothetical protein
MMMLFSVGVGVGFDVGGFEGAPVIGFSVGFKVGDFDGVPVVGGLVGWKEVTQEMKLDFARNYIEQKLLKDEYGTEKNLLDSSEQT